jgi:glutathione S-transferase
MGRKPRAMILEELADHVESLDLWLGDRSWLAGDALSIADLSVFVQLRCIQGTPEGEKAIAAKPRLTAWMARTDAATAPQS